MSAATKRSKSTMTAQHKEALALGREQGRVIRKYLEALDQHRPKRGRKRTPDSIKRQLTSVEQRLKTADPLTRLQLTQERMNLRTELDAKSNAVDLTRLEDDFVKAAKAYGQRKSISYGAWREAGVDAAVLKRAGIRRGG
jgi:hypothetical protein